MTGRLPTKKTSRQPLWSVVGAFEKLLREEFVLVVVSSSNDYTVGQRGGGDGCFFSSSMKHVNNENN